MAEPTRLNGDHMASLWQRWITYALILLMGLTSAPAYAYLGAGTNATPPKTELGIDLYTFDTALGEQYDPDLGMYFLRARYMDPNRGRFHSMDTFECVRTDPLSLHKYLYAHGNPVNGIDPSGHFNLNEINTVGLIVATLTGGIANGSISYLAEGKSSSFVKGFIVGAIGGAVSYITFKFFGPHIGSFSSGCVAGFMAGLVDGIAEEMWYHFNGDPSTEFSPNRVWNSAGIGLAFGCVSGGVVGAASGTGNVLIWFSESFIIELPEYVFSLSFTVVSSVFEAYASIGSDIIKRYD